MRFFSADAANLLLISPMRRPGKETRDPPDDRFGASALPDASQAAQPTRKTILMGEREGLIARIRHAGRSAVGADASAPRSTVESASRSTADSAPRSTVEPQDARSTRDERVGALEARVAHLERLVEGLQDSVYRESERHAKLIAELQAQIQPGAMGAALAEDVRSRGL